MERTLVKAAARVGMVGKRSQTVDNWVGRSMMGKPNGRRDATEWQLVSRRRTRRVSGEEEEGPRRQGPGKTRKAWGWSGRSRQVRRDHVRRRRDLTGWRTDRNVGSECRGSTRSKSQMVQKRATRSGRMKVKAQAGNPQLGATVTPIALTALKIWI